MTIYICQVNYIAVAKPDFLLVETLLFLLLPMWEDE